MEHLFVLCLFFALALSVVLHEDEGYDPFADSGTRFDHHMKAFRYVHPSMLLEHPRVPRKFDYDHTVVESTATMKLRYDVTYAHDAVPLALVPGALGVAGACRIGSERLTLRFADAAHASALARRVHEVGLSTLLTSGAERAFLCWGDDGDMLESWQMRVAAVEELGFVDGPGSDYLVTVRGRPVEWMEVFSDFDAHFRVEPLELAVPKLPDGSNATFFPDDYEPLPQHMRRPVLRADWGSRNLIDIFNFNYAGDGRAVRRNITIFNTDSTLLDVLGEVVTSIDLPSGSVKLRAIDSFAFLTVGLDWRFKYHWKFLKLKVDNFRMAGILSTGLSIGMELELDLESFTLPLVGLRFPPKGIALFSFSIPIAKGVKVKITPKAALDLRVEVDVSAYLYVRTGFTKMRYYERGSEYIGGDVDRWYKINKDRPNFDKTHPFRLVASGTVEPKAALAPALLVELSLWVIVKVGLTQLELVLLPWIVFSMIFPYPIQNPKLPCQLPDFIGVYNLKLNLDVEFSVTKLHVFGVRLERHIPMLPYVKDWEIGSWTFQELGCSKCSGCIPAPGGNLQAQSLLLDSVWTTPAGPAPGPVPPRLEPSVRFNFQDSWCTATNVLPAGEPGPMAVSPSRCGYCAYNVPQIAGFALCVFCPATATCLAYPIGPAPEGWELDAINGTECPGAWLPLENGVTGSCPVEEYEGGFNVTLSGDGGGGATCAAGPGESCNFTVTWAPDMSFNGDTWSLRAFWTLEPNATQGGELLTTGALEANSPGAEGLPAEGTVLTAAGAQTGTFTAAVPEALGSEVYWNGAELALAVELTSGAGDPGDARFMAVAAVPLTFVAPPSGFAWSYSAWSICSFDCGNGTFSTRTVQCIDLSTAAPAASNASCVAPLDALWRACAYEPCRPEPLNGVAEPKPGAALETAPPPSDIKPFSYLELLGNQTFQSGNVTVNGSFVPQLRDGARRLQSRQQAPFDPIVPIVWGGGTHGTNCSIVLECTSDTDRNVTVWSEELAAVDCAAHGWEWDMTGRPEGCRSANLVVREAENATASLAVLRGVSVHTARQYAVSLRVRDAAAGCPEDPEAFDVSFSSLQGSIVFHVPGAGTPEGVPLPYPFAVAALDPVLNMAITTVRASCARSHVLDVNLTDGIGGLWHFGVFAPTRLRTGTFVPGVKKLSLPENSDVWERVTMSSQVNTCGPGRSGCAFRVACAELKTSACDEKVGCTLDAGGACVVQEQAYSWTDFDNFVSTASEIMSSIFF